MGENIADNGGLRQAFYAYKLHSDKYGKEQKLPGLEKFTHEQLFFISFGHVSACLPVKSSPLIYYSSLQSFCETQTPTAMKQFLEDTHAPGRFRVNGVLANSHEFRSAFSCSSDSKMTSKDQCSIW